MGSANSSANGWNFQVVAGIILFFDDVRNIKSIKIEGNKQDIEIEYIDGTNILCQVKSAFKIDEYEKVAGKHLRDALKSLDEHRKCANTSFFYISNIPNPMNVSSSRGFYGYNAFYSFDELSEKDRNKIAKYLSSDFPFEKLKIGIFYFAGDDSKKMEFARMKIDDFCKELGIEGLNVRQLLNSYRCLFFDDACKERIINKSKEQFIWPLIVVYLSKQNRNNDCLILCGDDEEVLEQVLQKYDNYIDEKVEKYEMIGRYMSAYEEEKAKIGQIDILTFVGSYYSRFMDDFKIEKNEEYRAYLTKIVLYRVLSNRRTIQIIKRGSGL